MKRFIPLLLLVVVLGGCKLRADASVTVNEDESGVIGLEVSLDEELREVLTQQGQDFDLTDQLDGLPAGWSAEPFTEGEFEGIRASRPFSSFEDLEGLLAELADSDFGGRGNIGDLFTNLDLVHDGNDFGFSATLDDVSGSFESALGGDGAFGGFDLQTLFDSVFEVRLIVSLPGEVAEHNGDSLDGATVTWDIGLDSSGRTLTATSEVAGGGPNLALIGGIVAAVALLALGFVFGQRRNEQRAREFVAAAADEAVVEEGDGQP